MQKINIIGCGKLGKTIGKLFADKKIVKIEGIFNRTLEHANDSVKFIGSGIPITHLCDLPKADIHLITTPDDKIQKITEDITNLNVLEKNNIVIHCSGSLSSDILSAVKKHSCYIMSLHPIKSFADPKKSVSTFAGTYCAIEGDEEKIANINHLFTQIGGSVFRITRNDKSIYHAAGVLANNYLVTLHHHAVESYKRAGIESNTAAAIVNKLMFDAFDNLKNLPHHQALTGPIQRGDEATISKHLEALDSITETKNIYSALGMGTLELTEHSIGKIDSLRKVLLKV